MNTIKKFGIFSSSVDLNKLGKTVEGFIVGASVLIIYFASKAGIVIESNQISAVAVEVGSIVSTFMVLFGLIRKVVVMITTPPVVQVSPSDSLPPLE